MMLGLRLIRESWIMDAHIKRHGLSFSVASAAWNAALIFLVDIFTERGGGTKACGHIQYWWNMTPQIFMNVSLSKYRRAVYNPTRPYLAPLPLPTPTPSPSLSFPNIPTHITYTVHIPHPHWTHLKEIISVSSCIETRSDCKTCKLCLFLQTQVFLHAHNRSTNNFVS